jgi:hypothetical protein
MTKYLVLYSIPEPALEMATRRLERLMRLNPDVKFCPMFGPRQLIYVPMIYDPFMFGSNSPRIPLFGTLDHIVNWLFLRIPEVFSLSLGINEKITNIAKSDLITRANAQIKQMGFPSFFIDYTPMALWNLDHSIFQWFKNEGKNYDFDYLIFYESDIYTTKPLAEIYEKYAQRYDVCFSDFEVSTKDWHFYNFPPSCRRATIKWLKKKMLPTTIYKSIFAGALISRRCFEELSRRNIDFSGTPYCQNEMRLPTILSALGFRCGKLEFPYVRYRPEWSIGQINAHNEAGIFHPVKRRLPSEMAP